MCGIVGIRLANLENFFFFSNVVNVFIDMKDFCCLDFVMVCVTIFH